MTGWGRALLRLALLVVAGHTAIGCGDAARGDQESRASAASTDSLVRAFAAELLPELETLSGLSARRPLAVAVRSRAELESFLTAQLSEQLPPKRADALVRSYARLGLLPAELELDLLLRDLLLEQVVGYYDPARDTLYVMEGLDPALVEPVLAHEMVHALQDQYVDLDSLMRANQTANDRATAAQSALEGHATLAMLEWQLARMTGGSMGLDELPSFSSLPEDALMEAAGLEMPALASAPRLIRESLIFPYLGGLEFVRVRWRAEGGTRFAPLGDEMPVSTEQVLHPDRAFGPVRDDPVGLSFAAPLPPGRAEVHTDGLGELETRIWLREHLDDRERAEAAAAGWDGDRYRLTDGDDGEVFTWVTAWDSRDEADEFAAAAREVATTRRRAEPERRLDIVSRMQDGVPLVILTDRPAGLDATLIDTSVSIEPSGR
ncbi:MAG: hypothetical protein M8835_00775 [marine benthic group bacterium]|nr:hypothetical protein [Gemmatimonadota bacterium]